MLNRDEAREIIGDLWGLHVSERYRFERIARYLEGSAGLPDLPKTASDDIRDIRRISGKNIVGVVVDSFAENLSVSGFRNREGEHDAEAWKRWKAQRLATRQDEVHRSALTYGTGYAVVLPEGGNAYVRYRSPRRLVAAYRDPAVDVFPQFALEVWVTSEGGKSVLRGLLLDDTHGWPITFGKAPKWLGAIDAHKVLAGSTAIGEPVAHGAGVCPVVRFTDTSDDGQVRGEVEPLMTPQRAINSVNFDRLVVSRFGAFPQKVITGWAGTREEQLAASAKDLWAFEDPDVRAQVLMGSEGRGYNELIEDLMEHVAMVAKLSPASITGRMVNLSADALAAGEKSQQRKLARLRTSLGESHADVMRLMARIETGEDVDDFESETVWDDTEARSFAGVVDGITKLANVGVPVQHMLSLIPGLPTWQQQAIKRAMQGGQDFASLMNSITGAPNASADAAPADEPAQG